MRDCLVGIFGSALYAELNTRPPNPAEGAAMGPCMAAHATSASSESSVDGPFNPFKSADPELRDCLIAVFGTGLYEELRDRRPGPAENAATEPCMAAYMAPDTSGSESADTSASSEVPGDGAQSPASGLGQSPESGPAPAGPGGGGPELSTARAMYPPDLTLVVLAGLVQVSPVVDQCIAEQVGGPRLGALRSGSQIEGYEHDSTAQCLLQFGVPAAELSSQESNVPGAPTDAPGLGTVSETGEPTNTITVNYPATSYQPAQGATSGFFESAQDGDIALSSFGFNNSGGSLVFSKPSGLASDGTRLVMTDVSNNRVLIWNTAPSGSQAPDIGLGQPNFTTNAPGTGRGQMNWPVSASTDGTRLAVTDTMNDRILVWTSFPTTNGEPADLVLEGVWSAEPSKSNIAWPWGVWTDGERLVVTSTKSASVLVWNNFPTVDNQPADLLLTGSGDLGTPRQVTSDGNSLIVGDHNARALGGSEPGTFIWTSFPTTDDQPYDLFLRDPLSDGAAAYWLRGDFTDDGGLIVVGYTLHVWDSVPQSATSRPDLSITGQGDFGGYAFQGGDFGSLVVVGNRVYITTMGNTLIAYDSIPTSTTQQPDFVIGGTDIYSRSREENFILGNPVPASNGTNLFVTSDFDGKLYVWTSLPDESGAVPDVVYHFCRFRTEEAKSRHMCQGPVSPWDNALHGTTFALAGRDRLLIWTDLPLTGNLPDYNYEGAIGNLPLLDLTGVAIDDRYFYLADQAADTVYVWEGIPDGSSVPVATLSVDRPRRLSSDGTYLAVTDTFGHSVKIFTVDQIATTGSFTTVGGTGVFNLPEGATLSGGHLFVADTGFNQVAVWENVGDALSGNPADVILGASDRTDTRAEIGRNQLYMPAAISFDGSYLWVGEFKFSDRLIRYSPTG